MTTKHLLSPLQLGRYTLNNRAIMAPVTRGRAEDDGTPTRLMATYYDQRASAGLIIAEATAVNAQGRGWLNSPGIFTQRHIEGWQHVTQKVHSNGGKIFLQIWHMGATVHPDFTQGAAPLSSSEVTLSGNIRTPKNPTESVPLQPARAMTLSEIHAVENDFVQAASHAIEAGFDGVELHAANGFLIDQFIRDGVNQRIDDYGGSIANRLRLLKNITQNICKAIGEDRVGVRLSPTNHFWGISDSNPEQTFTQAVKLLNEYDLAYLHLLEPRPGIAHPMASEQYLCESLVKHFNGNIIVNAGYDAESANQAIQNNLADAVSFGTAFIANPDLVERIRKRSPWNTADSNTFYTRGPKGYTDYPTLW